MFMKILNWLFGGSSKKKSSVYFATGSQNGMTKEQAIEKSKEGYYIRRITWTNSMYKLYWHRNLGCIWNLWLNRVHNFSDADNVASDWITCGKVGE